MTLALAVALVFNVPAALQRAIPDYTGGTSDSGGRRRPDPEQAEPRRHRQRAERATVQLHQWRPAARKLRTRTRIKGITGWLNTPDGKPIDLKSLRGKVVSDRLLGLFLYQLPACDPTRRRLVPRVQRRRVRGDRCAHPRVRVRTVPENVASPAPPIWASRTRRAGQQLLNVDELPQQVLARRVLDRRERHRSSHQVRRRRLRRHRKADQAIASRRQPGAPAAGARATRPTKRPTTD